MSNALILTFFFFFLRIYALYVHITHERAFYGPYFSQAIASLLGGNLHTDAQISE